MKEKASEVPLFSKLKAHSVYTLARKKGQGLGLFDLVCTLM